jgi:hypothetical protein
VASLQYALDQMAREGMPPMPSGHPRLNTERIVRYGPKGRAWYRLYEQIGRNGRSCVSGVFGYWGLLPERGARSRVASKGSIATSWSASKRRRRSRGAGAW